MGLRTFNLSDCRAIGLGDAFIDRVRACGTPLAGHEQTHVNVDDAKACGKLLYVQFCEQRRNPVAAKVEPEKKPAAAPKANSEPPVPPSLIPRAKWPKWARLVAFLKIGEDTGVGDTVARIAAKLGGERFKAWAERLGIPCGCSERQENWNARYPYSS